MAVVVEEVVTHQESWAQNYTVSFSSAPVEGELIVLMTSTHNNEAQYKPIMPAGFTTVIDESYTWRFLIVGYKIAGPGEGTDFTITRDTEHYAHAVGYRLSGARLTATIRQNAAAHAPSGASGVSVSTGAATRDDGLALAYYHSHNTDSVSGAVRSWNSGWTDIEAFGVQSGGSTHKQTARRSTNGSVMTAEVTLDQGTNDRQSIAIIEIAPASDGSTAPAPGVPSLSGTASDSQVQWSWTAVDNATTYDLELDSVVNNLGDVTSYLDDGLTNGVAREARVRALTDGTPGDWSPILSRTPSTSSSPSDPDPIVAYDGDTDVSLGNPGFSGSVSEVTIKLTTDDGTYSQPLSEGVLSTPTDVTLDMPDLLNTFYETMWAPYSTDTYIMSVEVLSDDPGDGPYVVPITRGVPQGYDFVQLGEVETQVGSIFYGLSLPETVPPAGSQIVFSTADNTSIDPQGYLTTDVNGGFIHLWIWRTDTSRVEFERVFIPGQFRVRISGSPATLEPGTTYTATVTNAGGLIISGVTYSGAGESYPVVINSVSQTAITFTTSASLPAGSPVDFDFTV